MRVFVTGASGLVGSHTAERLRARGHDVVAFVRPTSDASFLERLGVKRIVGHLGDAPAQLAMAMAGCDAVVHAAAILFERVPPEIYHQVNVEGTERVLRAAGAAGARRALYISSVAVYGGRTDGRRVVEGEWLDRDIAGADRYGRSKRAAERTAWRLHDEGVVRLRTVRPGAVYGERDRAFTPWLARFARLPLLPLPGGGHHTVPVVYAGNVADGAVAALEREEAAGRAYNLSADGPLTARALIETFGRALGHVPRVVSAPEALFMAAAGIGDGVLGLLPGIPDLRLRRTARLLLDDNPYDDSRARQELDWQATVPTAQALTRTAAWWCGRAAAPG